MPEGPTQIVARVGVSLAASLQERDVLAAAVREVGLAVRAASCCLYDCSLTRELLTLRAAWSIDDDPDLQSLIGSSFASADRPSLFRTVRDRRAVETHVNDAGLSREMRDDLWNDLTTLAAPLIDGEELIGLVVVGDKSCSTRSPRRCCPTARRPCSKLRRARDDVEAPQIVDDQVTRSRRRR